MSKPRFQLELVVDTLAHAQTIVNNLQTQLSGKDIFETHSLQAYFDEEMAVNKVSADWRFNIRAERDDLRDWIRDQVQTHPQVKNWVLSARLSWHQCSHDDPELKDCKTTEFVEWNK